MDFSAMVAAPPPIRPLTPCLCMKSRPRALALTTGYQLKELTLVREGLRAEGLHDDLDLLLEERAIGVLIEHGRAERLDFSRVISAPDAKDSPAFGEDVGGGEVLGEAQRVPHGRDVEPAADAEA